MFDASSFDEGMRTILPGVLTDAQKKSKVKRPPNAYNLFFMDQQPIVKADNPALTGNEVSKELGRRWKEMNDDERRPYVERAKHIWDEVRLENPDYPDEKSKGHRSEKSTRHMSAVNEEDLQLNGYWMDWITSQILAQYAIQNKDVSDGVIASVTSDSLPLFLANLADGNQ